MIDWLAVEWALKACTLAGGALGMVAFCQMTEPRLRDFGYLGLCAWSLAGWL